jgi:hypothetical protein
MTKYENLSGESGIIEYDIFENSIDVKFNSGWTYTYTNVSADTSHINRMKELAREGFGLNRYIQKYLRKNYSDKKMR